jgi:hypothetical protein
MSGSWWRLLAAFLLILTSALLRAQNSSAGRSSISAPLLPPHYAIAGNNSGSSAPELVGRIPGNFSAVGRNPPAPVPTGFPQIARPAAIIFWGSVASIARTASVKASGANAITFKVERALRGARAGQNLTIHEWAGLWERGERYRVGERVFLFLYPPSRLGLTSPVAGGMGRFAVDLGGNLLLRPEHIQLLEADPLLGGKRALAYNDVAAAVERCRCSR